MSKQKLVGLIASGRMAESPLMRFPELARGLGPVVAESRRVASRYANALRGGRAAGMDELAECRLVLIQAPALAVPWAVSELLGACGAWRSRTVVWLNQGLGVWELERLRERRALVAAAGFAPTRDRPMLVVEGDRGAVRAVREWAKPARLRCVELPAGGGAMYQAGLILAGSMVGACMAASIALRFSTRWSRNDFMSLKAACTISRTLAFCSAVASVPDRALSTRFSRCCSSRAGS